jgi:penicillin-binding protein 1A
VWFIGYTPTYVTGVWMGYPGKKKPLGNDMTGGHGALPMFVDFMKTFLKDKPKEEFPKAPDMPEDMKELFRQRQRELAAERAEFAADADKNAEETATPATTTEPKMDQMTLPPPPKSEEPATTTPPKTEPATPKVEAPAPATVRPREVEPGKKKGKKGDGEP